MAVISQGVLIDDAGRMFMAVPRRGVLLNGRRGLGDDGAGAEDSGGGSSSGWGSGGGGGIVPSINVGAPTFGSSRGFDWVNFGKAASSIGGSIANIFSAAKGRPYPGINPYGPAGATTVVGSSPLGSGAFSISTPVLLLGGGLLLFVLLKRR